MNNERSFFRFRPVSFAFFILAALNIVRFESFSKNWILIEMIFSNPHSFSSFGSLVPKYNVLVGFVHATPPRDDGA
jgi:hypothetical protein